jgi:hypothetical protein
MRLRLGVLALLVLVAGCGSLAGGPEEEPDRTLTPAPVPEVTDTERPLPPGIDRGGLRNLDALITTHERIAGQTSYVWTETYNRTVWTRNGTWRIERDNTIWLGENDTYRHDLIRTRQFNGSGFVYRNESTFSSGTRAFHHDRTGRGRAFEQVPVAEKTDSFSSQAVFALRKYLTIRPTTVATVEREGSRYYRVVGRDRSVAGPALSTNYSVQALVTPEGFVRELSVQSELRTDDRYRVVTYQFTYRQVGNATVPRPAWLSPNGTVNATTPER